MAHLIQIEKFKAGQEVIIGKAGKPVAKLVRYERSEKLHRPAGFEVKSSGELSQKLSG
jgi:antitoxin (DNA-binding transcriptional repressor) of toxin-antitoxin stability system